MFLATPVHAAVVAVVAVTDDTGSTVTLAEPARRIVALAPHATETLFAAGAGGKVVGAVSYSDYPEAAKAIPRVGGYKSIDYERLLALDPDLVVAWESGNGPRMIDKLRELGLTVYVTEPRSLETIPVTIERLGKLAGTDRHADAAAAEFRDRYRELAERYRDRPPLQVFYQVWDQPLMTINGEHLISQVIRLCGGRNVFAELSTLAPAVGVESVLEARPDVIVASGMGEERPEWLDEWRRWRELPAVRDDNLYFIPPSIIQRHSPRILDGAGRLCAQLEEARRK